MEAPNAMQITETELWNLLGFQLNFELKAEE